MEQQPIAQYCVYTIVDGKRLSGLANAGRSDQFEERKPWVTARKLWDQACASKKVMPVLFGDAADCSRLLFWGVLIDVQVQEGVTRFSVGFAGSQGDTRHRNWCYVARGEISRPISSGRTRFV